jgi:broad specificity phosphatase PhoE
MRDPMGNARTAFLARHGETDWNAAGRWQGQTDVPLNANGRAQALVLAERMRSEGIAAVASSDLLRARGTAEIVAKMLGLEVSQLDPDLREQRFGIFEGLTRVECQERFPEEWARYVADSHTTPPDGESRSALVARVLPAVHRIAEQLASPALIVMHGGAMRALVSESVGSIPSPASAGWNLRGIPNGGIFRLSIAAGQIVDVMRIDTSVPR